MYRYNMWTRAIRLPPRDAAAAAEEERCGDEGFDY